MWLWCNRCNAKYLWSWWRHQMETFSALLAICAGNSPVTGEFHAQRPVTRSFDVYFHLPPNKRLSKQSWGWWFETQSCPLWCHCNVEKLTYWAVITSGSKLQEQVLTYWGWDKMAANVLRTTSNATYKFRLRLHWTLFPRVHLTIFQHWFK